MPHLVTSHQGVPHVHSYNAARLNAATYGNGKYVLPSRDRFAASIPDSNTIRIMGGDAMVCGRHWAIDGSYEEYVIENGVPGYSRIDLVVARIETSPSEQVEIIVRRGADAATDPVPPSWQDGDLNAGDSVAEQPLYHVRVDGLTPQEPVRLFDLAPDPYVGHPHEKDDITDLAAWAKADSKPSYTPDEVGAAAKSHSHVAASVTDLKAWLLANIYKVGCVWPSRVATNPASILGGTWVEITDTKLFIGVYLYRRSA